jgi:hypothetical protein
MRGYDTGRCVEPPESARPRYRGQLWATAPAASLIASARPHPVLLVLAHSGKLGGQSRRHSGGELADAPGSGDRLFARRVKTSLAPVVAVREARVDGRGLAARGGDCGWGRAGHSQVLGMEPGGERGARSGDGRPAGGELDLTDLGLRVARKIAVEVDDGAVRVASAEVAEVQCDGSQ